VQRRLDRFAQSSLMSVQAGPEFAFRFHRVRVFPIRFVHDLFERVNRESFRSRFRNTAAEQRRAAASELRERSGVEKRNRATDPIFIRRGKAQKVENTSPRAFVGCPAASGRHIGV
jgi:hypothetical protein